MDEELICDFVVCVGVEVSDDLAPDTEPEANADPETDPGPEPNADPEADADPEPNAEPEVLRPKILEAAVDDDVLPDPVAVTAGPLPAALDVDVLASAEESDAATPVGPRIGEVDDTPTGAIWLVMLTLGLGLGFGIGLVFTLEL